MVLENHIILEEDKYKLRIIAVLQIEQKGNKVIDDF